MDRRHGMLERGRVTVENRQEVIGMDPGAIGHLEQAATRALGLITERNLTRGERIDGAAVFLVDDRRIGEAHAHFFGDPDPTDVITFPLGNYGEILVGVETAQRQAGDFGTSFGRETALYVVHGLLHLCGYEDATEEGRARMAELQDAIVAEVYGQSADHFARGNSPD